MELIVIRHGEASHNFGGEKLHMFAGSQIDNDLSPEGIENAHLLACELKDARIDSVFASPLKRSKNTAKIIIEDLGINVSIKEEENLKEINIGDFAGHTEEKAKQLFPKSAKAFYDGDIENWDFPKGENFQQVLERVNRVIDNIKNTTKVNQTILISGHGMINRVLFYKLLPERKDLWQERNYPHDRIVTIEV